MRRSIALGAGAAVMATILATAGVSGACGGGAIVTTRVGGAGADTQRVLLSVHLPAGGAGAPTTTDVITQIGVPETTDDYGALLPLPSAPTLDATPVEASDLDALDRATAPRIFESHPSEDSGCGCLGAVGGGADSTSAPGEARVSAPVNIGPVTAVVLNGEASAIDAWLEDNRFVLSDTDRGTLASYVGYYFVAIKRNETAPTGGPTSIGIHFTMAGDHREVPLRFASIGAAPTVAVTLFLAVAEQAGPSPPFAALTLNDLDRNDLKAGDYRRAVQNAVSAHGDKAFVLESRHATADLQLGARLGSLLDGGATLTRMSTVVAAEALTADALFHTPYTGTVPGDRYVTRTLMPLGSREVGLGCSSLLLLGRIRRRRRSQRAR